MNWLDILLLAVFVLHLLNGFFHGLVKQFFDLVGFLVVIVFSFWGSRHISGLLAAKINTEDIIPHHELIESLGLEVALDKAPQLIAAIIVFLVMFLVLSLLFRIISGSFRWVNKVPVIGFFNRLGGAVLGALIGITFVYLIIAGMSLIPLQLFEEALDNSEAVFIANHYLTPIADWLKGILLKYFLSLNG